MPRRRARPRQLLLEHDHTYLPHHRPLHTRTSFAHSFLEHKYPGDYEMQSDVAVRTTAMATVSFTVGLVVTLIGLCRLGFLLDFVSTPVLTGFIMAACTITILACIKVRGRRAALHALLRCVAPLPNLT